MIKLTRRTKFVNKFFCFHSIIAPYSIEIARRYRLFFLAF